MKRFFLRSLLYLSPLLLVICLIFIVDPYYLFNKESFFDEQKYEIGYSFDQGRRYKIFTYWNNPTDKIILGASEINIINERNIPEVGWHSLSYGGAPLQESLRMYWEASNKHSLSKVIIAPEFIKFYNAVSSANGDPYYTNFSWRTSQSAKALEIYNNKLDYFIDKNTLKSTWSYLTSLLVNSKVRSKPAGTKEDFWKHQMDYARITYQGNVVLEEKKKEIMTLFREIKTDADKNGTEIMIIIPIQHVDLLKEEYSEKVFGVYHDYIKELATIFDGIYYLAFFDGISSDAEMFSDPFHCVTEEPYIQSIFGDDKMELLTVENINARLMAVKKILYCNGE